MWAGIAGAVVNDGASLEIAISIHDSVYNTDYTSFVVPWTQGLDQSEEIEAHVLKNLRTFEREHMCKFLGAGVTLSLLREVR